MLATKYNRMMEKKNVDQTTLSQNNYDEEVLDAFTRMSASLHTLSTLISLETKLTLSELSASEHLRLDGPLAPKEISNRIHLSTGATTGMLDRLERRGFVRRTAHPTDRRSMLVHYLEQESPRITKLENLQKLLEVRVGQLDRSQREVVASFLRGVSSDIAEVVGETSP